MMTYTVLEELLLHNMLVIASETVFSQYVGDSK